MARFLVYVCAIALSYGALARVSSERWRRVLAIGAAPLAWGALAWSLTLLAFASPELPEIGLVLATAAFVVTAPFAAAACVLLISRRYARAWTIVVANGLAWTAGWVMLALCD